MHNAYLNTAQDIKQLSFADINLKYTNKVATTGYCHVWYQFYKDTTQSETVNASCQAFPGPTGTGYYSYVQLQNLTKYYFFNNLLHTGNREAFVPYRNPPNQHNICPQRRDYAHLDRSMTTNSLDMSGLIQLTKGVFTSWISNKLAMPTETVSTSIIPEYKLACFQVMNDPEICNELPYCWYRPGFERCLPIYDPTQIFSSIEEDIPNNSSSTYSNIDSLTRRQSLTLDFQRGYNYPSTPQIPCDFHDDWKIWSITFIAITSGLLFFGLLGLFGIIALLATSCGLAKIIGIATSINGFFVTRTIVDFPRHIPTETVSSTLLPVGPVNISSAIVSWSPFASCGNIISSSQALRLNPLGLSSIVMPPPSGYN